MPYSSRCRGRRSTSRPPRTRSFDPPGDLVVEVNEEGHLHLHVLAPLRHHFQSATRMMTGSTAIIHCVCRNELFAAQNRKFFFSPSFLHHPPTSCKDMTHTHHLQLTTTPHTPDETSHIRRNHTHQTKSHTLSHEAFRPRCCRCCGPSPHHRRHHRESPSDETQTPITPHTY